MIQNIKRDFKSFYLPLILSIVVSYIFYLVSIKERIPVFSVEPLRTRIIDSKTISTAPIQIIGPDSTIIKNDLSAVTFHFWNRGGEAIEQSDVLKPIHVTFDDPSVKLIDIKINKLSRADITKSKAQIDNSKKAVLINFSILDEGDGLSCQAIFEGNPESKLIINGAIKGVKTFDNFNVSLLQFLSITLALCALATITIIFALRIFTWWTYITYKDMYVDEFYYLLHTNQLVKAEEYTIAERRDSETFKELLKMHIDDKSKFDEISKSYINKLRKEAKNFFYNTPFIEGRSWQLVKNVLYFMLYTTIAFSTWNTLRESPEIINPINKTSYYSMIKNILTPSEPRIKN